METRKMTIARGLTRLKTIKAQLSRIALDIAQYGAWCDKKKHPLGDTTKNDLKANHNQAREVIRSLHQQYHDLMQEYIRIKTAIDRANMNTFIEVGGVRMSVHQALLYKRDVADMMTRLVGSHDTAVSRAERQVQEYNNRLNGMDEESKQAVQADVAYLIDQEEIKKTRQFLDEFAVEIDGLLNEINAVTEIEVE